MTPTRTAKKSAAKKAPARNATSSTDPNAGRTNAENPVETHEAQEAAAGVTSGASNEDAKDAVKVQIVEAPVETDYEQPETTTVDQDYVFMHNLDPARQIPGTNKYLDVEQRKAAEIDRAAVEGREPDLENPPAAQGTPYRSAQQLAAELPPHATVKADVTLPVTVTKEEAQAYEDREEVAKELQTVGVFNDPAKAQDRETDADGAKQPQDAEGNKNAESGK